MKKIKKRRKSKAKLRLNEVIEERLQRALAPIENLKVIVNGVPVLVNKNLAYGVYFINKKTKKHYTRKPLYYSVTKLLAYVDLVKKGCNSVKGL